MSKVGIGWSDRYEIGTCGGKQLLQRRRLYAATTPDRHERYRPHHAGPWYFDEITVSERIDDRKTRHESEPRAACDQTSDRTDAVYFGGELWCGHACFRKGLIEQMPIDTADLGRHEFFCGKRL